MKTSLKFNEEQTKFVQNLKYNFNRGLQRAVNGMNEFEEDKVKLLSSDQGGFTLIEMLVSSFIMVIVLVLTLMVFITYNQSFNATLSLTKAQLQAEGAMNSLASMARSATDCPGAASDLTYVVASNTLTLSVPFPKRLFTDSTTGATTDIQEVSVSLNTTTHDLTGVTSSCPGYSGNSYSLVSADHVTAVSFGFENSKLIAGYPTWPPTSGTTPNPSGNETIGIQFNITVNDAGQQIQLTNVGYFVNLFCAANSQPPAGYGGCVV